MCGIVGAVVKRQVTPILLEGLKRMEYRGYDSAGLAVIDLAGELKRVRTNGKVNNLVEAVMASPVESHIGIAHTRWATHGAPSELNAHPHVSGDPHRVAVVHNGIIENYQTLKDELITKGYHFTSETDTEVIAHLIHLHMQDTKDFKQAVRTATKRLIGAFSLGVMSTEHPNCLIATRQGSPLVLGIGFQEHYFASDHLALLPVTQKFMYMQEGDLALVYADKLDIVDINDKPVKREIKTFSTDALVSTDKGQYRHYMLKEIFEQALVVQETLEGRIVDDHILDAIFGPKADGFFDKTQAIQIVACGTSYHAGLVAKYWIEAIAKIPCAVEVASEYRYRDVVVSPNTLFVVISQSGETADTLSAMRKAKELGYLSTVAICNVPESAMVREADLVMLTRAGTEVGVASTKAFTTQLVSLALLALSLAKRHKTFDTLSSVRALKALPRVLEQTLQLNRSIERLAQHFADKTSALFVARGCLYPIALEGALKLKEISYIHAEAYPAGELKHGPLALVDNQMPVVAMVHDDHLSEKMLSNLQEIKARGGQLMIFTDIQNLSFIGAEVITLPVCDNPFAAPIIHTLPMQLLAYYVAILKGTDVDQPRNLAKSVTVE